MAITLKAARINTNMTQREAAERLGISPDTLRKYEAGETFPTVLTIQKIESLYGLTYNDINFLCPKETV